MAAVDRVDKTTIIGVALRVHPQATAVFEAHGMDCETCMGANEETMENAARMCRADIESLLRDLNRLLGAEE